MFFFLVIRALSRIIFVCYLCYHVGWGGGGEGMVCFSFRLCICLFVFGYLVERAIVY